MINPELDFPKRNSLKNSCVSRFEELQTGVMRLLQKNDSKISYTIDGWTSIAGRSYYGITAHFIDSQWEYRSIPIDFVPANGLHTGKDIASLFYKCLEKYEVLDKIQGITVDNATNNTTFMSALKDLLPTFDPENQHFRCFAHILNLGVQDLMKKLALGNKDSDFLGEEMELENRDVNYEFDNNENAITKIRSLFSKIKKSEQLGNKFKSACLTVGEPEKSPILDVPTRWNSTHNMMGVALQVEKGISLICDNNSDLKKFKLIADEWHVIAKIHLFLEDFENLSTKLGGEKYSTLPMVTLLFNMLLDKIEAFIGELNNKSNRSGIDENLLQGYVAARDKMLKHYRKTNWIYCIALVLDPRFKLEPFLKTVWGKELKECTLEKLEDMFNIYFQKFPNSSVNDLDSSQSELFDFDNNEKEGLQNFNAVCEASCSSNKIENASSELQKYLDLPRAPKKGNNLNWWKDNQKEFPILSKIARDILSISATSVPSERLFSRASLIIRKHRNRLNNQSARVLLCINSWVTNELFEDIQQLSFVDESNDELAQPSSQN